MMDQNEVDYSVLTSVTGNSSSSWYVSVIIVLVLSLLHCCGSEKRNTIVRKPWFDDHCQRVDNGGVDCMLPSILHHENDKLSTSYS
jgi:hypothetical protein